MKPRDNLKGWAIFALILLALAVVGHMDEQDATAKAYQPTTYHF